MLEEGLRFLESLPQSMKRAVGNVIYGNLALRPKQRKRTLRNFTRILAILGVIFFIYRRFIRK